MSRAIVEVQFSKLTLRQKGPKMSISEFLIKIISKY